LFPGEIVRKYSYSLR